MRPLPREVFDLLSVEDMPSDDLQRIAQVCGMENALKLLRSFAGQSVYFPDYWLKKCLPKVIRIMLAQGSNRKGICKTLGISRMTYYRAMNMKVPGFHIPPRKPPVPATQLNLLEE
jgi:hypothetical protein